MVQSGEKGHGRQRHSMTGAEEVCSRNMMPGRIEPASQNGVRDAGGKDDISWGRTCVSARDLTGHIHPFGFWVFTLLSHK